MQALVVNPEAPNGLSLISKDIPTLQPGEVLVKVHAAALNRRDYWISVGQYPGIRPGVTLGSDASGVVEAGPDAWIKKSVVINPNISWGENPEVQADTYHILGMPTDGTLAEYLVVHEDRLVEMPKHLSFEEAAALPLAGLTAYRALMNKADLKTGDRVLITGVGGGVNHLALLLAVNAGFEVAITSGSKAKLELGLKLGAVEAYDYHDDNWVKAALKQGKFDAIIDSAGGNAINDYLKLIKPGGKVVIYGSTLGKTESLDLFRLFWSQAALVGSTMGNDMEFQAMIEFVSKHKIKPHIHQIFTLDHAFDAISQMKDSQQFGKIVVKMP